MQNECKPYACLAQLQRHRLSGGRYIFVRQAETAVGRWFGKLSKGVLLGDLERLHSPIGRVALLPRADLSLGNVPSQVGSNAFRVGLVLPRTCIHCGEVVETKSLAGKRGHMVIGHWRLISGVAEPFFTRVDGHERGDRALGYITKERAVSAGSERRKGFLVLNVPGRHGEPRAATTKSV